MKQTENDNHLRNVFISVMVVLIITFTILMLLKKRDEAQIETNNLNTQIVDLRAQISLEDSLARLEQDSLKNAVKDKETAYIQTKVKTQIKYVIQKDSFRLLPIDSVVVFLTSRLTNK